MREFGAVGISEIVGNMSDTVDFSSSTLCVLQPDNQTHTNNKTHTFLFEDIKVVDCNETQTFVEKSFFQKFSSWHPRVAEH